MLFIPFIIKLWRIFFFGMHGERHDLLTLCQSVNAKKTHAKNNPVPPPPHTHTHTFPSYIYTHLSFVFSWGLVYSNSSEYGRLQQAKRKRNVKMAIFQQSDHSSSKLTNENTGYKLHAMITIIRQEGPRGDGGVGWRGSEGKGEYRPSLTSYHHHLLHPFPHSLPKSINESRK